MNTAAIIKRFLADQTGAAAVYFALISPMLIGMVALGSEVGYWFSSQRDIQHIADVAAYSGAVRQLGGDSAAAVKAAANAVIAQSDPPAGITTVIDVPPTTGSHIGQTRYVEVRMTRQVQRMFSRIYSTDPVNLTARAVAGYDANSGSPVCMLALSNTAAGAVTVGGSSIVDVDGCSIASNSVASNAFLMNGGAVNVTAGCVETVGGVSVTTGLTLTQCASPLTYQPTVTDPYANLQMPIVTGTPVGISTLTNTTFTPSEVYAALGLPLARFQGGVRFKGTVTLGAGLYIIDGGTLDISANSVVNGSNIAIFLANGADLKINGTATLNLSARTSDPLGGLLFFSSPSEAAVSHTINGNANSTLNGAIYFPNSDISFLGNSGNSSSCVQIIGKTITISGNTTLNIHCTPQGGHPMRANVAVRLVE